MKPNISLPNMLKSLMEEINMNLQRVVVIGLIEGTLSFVP